MPDHLFHMRWPEVHVPACGHERYYLHGKRHLYECKACRYQASLPLARSFTARDITESGSDDFLIARPKSGISMLSLQRMLRSRATNGLADGTQIRKQWLTGIRITGLQTCRMDDSYFYSKTYIPQICVSTCPTSATSWHYYCYAGHDTRPIMSASRIDRVRGIYYPCGCNCDTARILDLLTNDAGTDCSSVLRFYCSLTLLSIKRVGQLTNT